MNTPMQFEAMQEMLDILQKSNESKQQEINELKAHVKRLRVVIVDATNNGAMLDSGKWIYSIDDAVLSELPAQSLNHIKAQVEEETIEYDAKLMDADHNEYAASRIRERERKYKEQSDEG